jgi:lysine 2,3-aminomutase
MLVDQRIDRTSGEHVEKDRDTSSSPLIPAKAGTRDHRRAAMHAKPGSPLSRGRAGGWERSPRAQPTLRTPAALAEAGLIPPDRIAALEGIAARYAVAITPAMVDLIDAGDLGDPIARQFVPDAAELAATPDENADPIGDGAHEVTPGLIHRYPDRVLLKLVSACAVYCRFCFRRETVGQGEAMSKADVAAALGYIRARPEIWEVIVSGGDPLVASPRRLRTLTAALAEIDHVKVVRFHTRVPVVAPERITPELVAALQADGTTTWVAIHANHPRELSEEARAAVARLADAGIPLVGQTVLLKGVNDDPATLAALMRAFVEARVKPYYLHHGDLAPGTSNFRTTIAGGQALTKALRGRVSGLCQPAYVLDIPGGHGKVPIGPQYVEATPGGWALYDFSGGRHAYRDGM